MVERRQPKPTVDFIDEYCQYYRNLFSDVRDLQVINCPTVSQNFRAKPRRVVVSLDRATPTVGQFIFWIFLRGFEAFKYLHMGMISEIKPKTLPAIAKVVGLDNHQPLHHFLTVSPWDIKLLREQRLQLILDILSGRPIILMIDETGDKKKGKSTDYVKRQYRTHLGSSSQLSSLIPIWVS